MNTVEFNKSKITPCGQTFKQDETFKQISKRYSIVPDDAPYINYDDISKIKDASTAIFSEEKFIVSEMLDGYQPSLVISNRHLLKSNIHYFEQVKENFLIFLNEVEINQTFFNSLVSILDNLTEIGKIYDNYRSQYGEKPEKRFNEIVVFVTNFIKNIVSEDFDYENSEEFILTGKETMKNFFEEINFSPKFMELEAFSLEIKKIETLHIFTKPFACKLSDYDFSKVDNIKQCEMFIKMVETVAFMHFLGQYHGRLAPTAFVISNEEVCLYDMGISYGGESKITRPYYNFEFCEDYLTIDENAYKEYGQADDIYALGKIFRIMDLENSFGDILANCFAPKPERITASKLLQELRMRKEILQQESNQNSSLMPF